MKLYNTLTKQKEEFVPVHEGKVGMYVCGPTVYNYIHIGNARPMIVFDTVRRYFEYKGYDVNYVSNFTDVDDKIIKKANEEGVPASEISERFIAECKKDMEGLNIEPATHNPKATEEIDGMIAMISTLIEKGYAYEKNGTVYFRTRKFKNYGQLSKKNLDDMRAGIRIAVSDEKEDAMDFVLWKPKKEGEPAWVSPWGEGRPGWHIECSAMAKKYLGSTIDIHAGGEDLQFPHHENEIAQSEAHNGCEFSHYWMHNGYINIDGTKMSKSLGNFKTVRDLLQHYDGEVLRFLILSGQYRGPIDFNSEILEQSRNAMTRLRNAKSNLNHLIETGSGSMTDEEKEKLAGYDKYRQEFIKAMDDDLNTADAISAVFELVTAINTAVKDGASKEFAEKSLATLMELATVLGLLQQDVEEKVEIDDELAALIEERQQARKEKNFARADEIRDMLKARGLILKDTPQGVQIIKE